MRGSSMGKRNRKPLTQLYPPPDLISNVIHQISYVRHTYSKAMHKAEDNYTSEYTSTQQFTACH